VRFHKFSFSADQAIDRFYASVLANTDTSSCLFYQKLALCNFEVLLVTLDWPDCEHLTGDIYDPHTLNTLFIAWRSIVINSTNISEQKKAWRIIDRIGEVLQKGNKNKCSPILRHFKNDLEYNHFFVLLNGKEPQGIPVSEFNPLCNVWQLANGRLPLHAAGIIHKDQLFIFAGPSGAGKSTVAKLSQEIGDKILDEDQLLVYKSAGNGYQGDAWGYGLATCNLPIRAIFNLTQNTKDKIIAMKTTNFAKLLFERHNDIMGNQFSDELSKHSFKFIAELARQIPGYELHFRKSPAFWKLIDEQFPG